jgi:hypothetical protein
MPSFSWWSGNAFIMMTIVAYGEKKVVSSSCIFCILFSKTWCYAAELLLLPAPKLTHSVRTLNLVQNHFNFTMSCICQKSYSQCRDKNLFVWCCLELKIQLLTWKMQEREKGKSVGKSKNSTLQIHVMNKSNPSNIWLPCQLKASKVRTVLLIVLSVG